MMHAFAENIKTLLEQRWTIWRLQLELCLRESLLADDRVVSRQAFLRVFGNNSQWKDTKMCALSDVQPGNEFSFSHEDLAKLCDDLGVCDEEDAFLVSAQEQALFFSAERVLKWTKIK